MLVFVLFSSVTLELGEELSLGALGHRSLVPEPARNAPMTLLLARLRPLHACDTCF